MKSEATIGGGGGGEIGLEGGEGEEKEEEEKVEDLRFGSGWTRSPNTRILRSVALKPASKMIRLLINIMGLVTTTNPIPSKTIPRAAN